MRRGPCREALREVLHLQPRYANVFLLDRQGDPVCGALEPRGGAAMPNLADREGVTPLAHARQRRHEALAALLSEAGAR